MLTALSITIRSQLKKTFTDYYVMRCVGLRPMQMLKSIAELTKSYNIFDKN